LKTALKFDFGCIKENYENLEILGKRTGNPLIYNKRHLNSQNNKIYCRCLQFYRKCRQLAYTLEDRLQNTRRSMANHLWDNDNEQQDL